VQRELCGAPNSRPLNVSFRPWREKPLPDVFLVGIMAFGGLACLLYRRQRTSTERSVECAPGAGQVEVSDLTGVLGFRKMKAMARQQRSHSIEFKRQVVQEYIAGETLYGLAKRHDLSRQLIRVWVEKYEAGGLDADAQAADLLHEYETKIVALERMVGRQALEIEFLKGALKNAPRPRSATTSVIAGPTASPSQKDAG